MAKGTSKATLHFSKFSDVMIERYIATGEPLEVAGSFTLDGFGGAFIGGIEGDPSGIIGSPGPPKNTASLWTGCRLTPR